MTNLDSILKSRDITLPTKVHLQGYGFSSGHVCLFVYLYVYLYGNTKDPE